MLAFGWAAAPFPSFTSLSTHGSYQLLVPESLLQNKGESEEGDSLVMEFRQLVAQNDAMVHPSACDGDQVDDAPAGAVSVHGQGDRCGGCRVEKGSESGLAAEVVSRGTSLVVWG